jgi:hypothetical protein
LNDSKCKLVINGRNAEDSEEKEFGFVKMLEEKNILNFQIMENEFHMKPKRDFLNIKRLSLLELFDFLSSNDRKNKGSLLLYTRYFINYPNLIRKKS